MNILILYSYVIMKLSAGEYVCNSGFYHRGNLGMVPPKKKIYIYLYL